MLPKENKELFHEDIDIKDDKGKLRTVMEVVFYLKNKFLSNTIFSLSLIKQSDELIKVMKHEEDLREWYERNILVKIIASNKTLWEDLTFGINLALNFIIIASYS
jgi:hypothetical protein